MEEDAEDGKQPKAEDFIALLIYHCNSNVTMLGGGFKVLDLYTINTSLNRKMNHIILYYYCKTILNS